MEAQKPAAKYALSSFYSSRALSQNSDDRKRKITDKNLPNVLVQSPEFAEDSAMYRDLLQMERKLDWTMTRKRVEVHDALQRIIPVSLAAVLLRATDEKTGRQQERCGYSSATPSQGKPGSAKVWRARPQSQIRRRERTSRRGS